LRGGNRNDLLQVLDDGSLANVPHVEHLIDAFEMSSNHRIECAIGVGDYPDSTVPLPSGRGGMMKNLYSQRLQSRELHLKHAQEEMPCCKNSPYLPPAPLLHP
jgi:hypothetical protein